MVEFLSTKKATKDHRKILDILCGFLVRDIILLDGIYFLILRRIINADKKIARLELTQKRQLGGGDPFRYSLRLTSGLIE